jgi:hypothetical protein
MKPKQLFPYFILSLFLLLILLYIVFYWTEIEENIQISIKMRTIEKDGFCVLCNPIYAENTQDIPSKELQKDVLRSLPSDYVFLDYIYTINDVALSTFHRDITSSQHVYHTKNPVYTMILYKYDGELLSLCPSSNTTYPFVWSSIVNINGKSGTVFLFNSDILHAGRINQCKEREVIQYKIAHIEDIPKLKHLQGIRMKKQDKCENTAYQFAMRKLSYFFEMPINTFLYPIMIKREHDNSFIGKIQSYIPITYYNNI